MTVAAALTVIAEVSVAPVRVAGLKPTVRPAGAPLLVRATSAVKFVRVSVRVAFPDPLPACTDSVVGATAIAMLEAGGAVTVTVSVAVAFATPVPAP